MPKVSDEYRDARRAQVLDAARRCFVRDGFHATSMADVCREAGVSSGVVYLYFASKDNIITALASENLDGIAKAAHTFARQHGDRGAGAVLAELLAYIRSEHERDALAALALLTWSESLRNEVLAERLRDAFADVHGLFTILLGQTGHSNQLRAPSTDATASVLVSVLVGYVMQLATLQPGATELLPGAVTVLWGQNPVRRPTLSSGAVGSESE
jgi:AcrR family transcriptional regulator